MIGFKMTDIRGGLPRCSPVPISCKTFSDTAEPQREFIRRRIFEILKRSISYIVNGGSFMSDFIIVTDSCCDMPDELARELGVVVIPMVFTLGGKTYHNYLDWRELSARDFYRMLGEGRIGATAAVNPETFIDVFEPLLKAGRDIFYIGLSAALSSTNSASIIAIDELRGRYPDRTVHSTDTLCASLGEGLLVYLVAKKRQSGCTLAEAVEYADAVKRNVCHWFTVDDLSHLKRGGRISATTALIGNALNIKPILRIDDNGCLVSAGKVRGRKEAIRTLARSCTDSLLPFDDRRIFIVHGGCEEDAGILAKSLRRELGDEGISVSPIGPVIGMHTGPGALGIAFLGTSRSGDSDCAF